MISDEKLMAFVDDELAPAEREQVVSALEDEPGSKALLSREKLLRQRLSESFASDLFEPLPASLIAAVKGGERAVATMKSPRPGRPWLAQATALAASLALGLFLGANLSSRAGSWGSDDTAIASGELGSALEKRLASAPTGGDIQIGVSFFGPEGRPCRTFETDRMSGLACREAGQWRLMLTAPSRRSEGDYAQASTASDLIMSSAQEMMTAGAMDATEERRARDAGWPRAGQEPR